MKGVTYFEPTAISINEGCVPNIHVAVGYNYFFIYICWWPNKRWHKLFITNPWIVEYKTLAELERERIEEEDKRMFDLLMLKQTMKEIRRMYKQVKSL